MSRSGNPPVWRADTGSPAFTPASRRPSTASTAPHLEITFMGSVIKKRRKRMAKKKHRKLLRKTRVARRKAGK
jgi:hypothetical protein